MYVPSRSIGALALLALVTPSHAQDIVVESGEILSFNTNIGPLRLDNLTIEAGGAMIARGRAPLRIYARRSIVIDGVLDLSGSASMGVTTLNTANIPELGSDGGPAGGRGGIASRLTSQSTPEGFPGGGTGPQSRGGIGGETGFQFILGAAHERRGAGGGGGALGPDQPVSNDPDADVNVGLVAQAGVDGSSLAFGANSQAVTPRAGRSGTTPFMDGDADNDFFGRRREASGAIVHGELAAPIAGRGGGAGGDALPSATFPSAPFTPSSDEKGAGGGGGGGLAILQAPRVSIGGLGAIRANGGDGGGGENTLFFDRIGGGSGAGSGGFLLLQARILDLSAAGPDSLSARGGHGGPGANNQYADVGAGGNGGPGLIQLHLPRGIDGILLPPGRTLDDVTTPRAHVLLPERGL
ncbi:MAG: hypothetical protein ACI8QZ_002637 [Chlamydiales bacterium]|jgi:hypothetical protein